MPEIVALGRKHVVQACGVYHRADGPGGPENSGLAGLPASYIVQQKWAIKWPLILIADPLFEPPRHA